MIWFFHFKVLRTSHAPLHRNVWKATSKKELCIWRSEQLNFTLIHQREREIWVFYGTFTPSPIYRLPMSLFKVHLWNAPLGYSFKKTCNTFRIHHGCWVEDLLFPASPCSDCRGWVSRVWPFLLEVELLLLAWGWPSVGMAETWSDVLVIWGSILFLLLFCFPGITYALQFEDWHSILPPPHSDFLMHPPLPKHLVHSLHSLFCCLFPGRPDYWIKYWTYLKINSTFPLPQLPSLLFYVHQIT